jgi:hypothetical protein
MRNRVVFSNGLERRSFTYAGHKMKIGQIAGAALTVLLFGCRVASAEQCVILSDPRYKLAADAVTWSMKVKGGHRSICGVRVHLVEFESVRLVSPPQSGQVELQGWGFSYTPKDGFWGEDSFALEVSGNLKKLRGSSTIHIVVSVVGGDLPEIITGSIDSGGAHKPVRPVKPESVGRGP